VVTAAALIAGAVGALGTGAAAPAAARPAAIARAAGHPSATAGPVAAHLLPAAVTRPAQLAAAEVGSTSAVSASALTATAKKAKLTPRQIARRLMPRFHWSVKKQFRFLNYLWSRESSWNKHAENPYTGAYGIPQAVPGAKMSTAGAHWQTSARTQILWGLKYIKSRYGSPHAAWDHELATGWY